MDRRDLLTIGEVARRSGVAPSALRYYESLGLVTSTRTPGDRRRYERAALRRVAVIRAAQRVGLSLEEIGAAFEGVPVDAAPTRAQWTRMSARWRPALERRIADLERVRDDLTGCIGCGCLSLQRCRLYNPDDDLGDEGSGSRRLFPDETDAD
ncbi:Redox-sensitive transcriptional activator SoxR [Nocardioides dokdonensis FR1436]|uniref:Redox-sensitive transcriptional activator SoxR n=1 Tax=Nocardioides dokdonensis FR1436 TaxID=1300347 RepID=A0A1A9GHJ3_9ACTN|nr:redox-sensitive transcriptional activator SoxR [Nocardioides dokdonensis]ANH37140.1 Redox-sensitive transcriptional activator SoxR [Nocardioides dokdonensis FR1436]